MRGLFRRRPGGRALQLLVLGGLVGAALYTHYGLYELGQTRFFTVDEYQYGHATWLVSRGSQPYRDFYEHHFPLSYVLHSPSLLPEGSFPEKALRLRLLPTAYGVGASLLVALGVGVTTRRLELALLASFLPLAVGFGRMSAVDYRADNFGAFLLLGSLALAQANRVWRRRAVAAGAGLLLGASLLTTQKMLLLAGVAFGGLWGTDRVRARRGRAVAPLLVHPLPLAASAGALLAASVALAASLGLLERAFEITILQAFAHEAAYPSVSVARYAAPFLAATPLSSGLLLLGFAGWLAGARRLQGFWVFPALAALLFGALLRAQYPYNYVLHSFLVGLGACFGLALLAERVRATRARAWAPLLYLLPLALLPNQLGFARDASTNAHQLDLLAKIERLTEPSDAVIDGAGGALFRPDGSYYYYHGAFHRERFAAEFARELPADYRRSGALLWIRDFRLRELPEPVLRYFRRHYVQADGPLFALGFRLPPARERSRELLLDVVREDLYRLHRSAGLRAPAPGALPPPSAPPRVWIDGERVREEGLRLERGVHRVRIGASSPSYTLTPLPAEAFRQEVGRRGSHTFQFEYDPARSGSRARRTGGGRGP